MTSRSSPTVCFLVLPYVHLMDLSGPAQVFYEATQIGPANYRVVYAGISQEARSEQGLSLGSLLPFEDVALGKGDMIVVPGIDFKSFKAGRFAKEVRAIRKWLHARHQSGVTISSICSGALILAESGILDGRKCTTHWKCVDYIKERYPKVNVLTDQLYVYDKNVYTSAGMTSGIDMTLSILERAHGPLLPAKVAREIVVFMRRNNTDSQRTIYLDYQTHFNPAIHRVQDYIISHPSKNTSLGELADIANVSVRNLTRLFRKATGHSIVDFKNAVKIEFARNLVHNAEYTVEKIAAECGFNSARHLRRVWEQAEGEPFKRKIQISNSK